jgi:hypothetical protein
LSASTTRRQRVIRHAGWLSITGVVIVVALALVVAAVPFVIPSEDVPAHKLAAAVIFAASYFALAIGKIPGLSLDRAGVALRFARLLPGCGYHHLLDLVAPAIDKPYGHAMKLIFIHGAPASGKLTVARALLRAVPGRLFDNHAAIDLALTVFDFGAPGFWQLVDIVWSSAIDVAAKHEVALIATTYCYAEREDRERLERVERLLKRHGGELRGVE